MASEKEPVAHAPDPQVPELHGRDGGSTPHRHLILEDWPHDRKQRAGNHLDTWHGTSRV